MGAMEIVLIIAGIIVTAVSFLISDKKETITQSVDSEDIKSMASDIVKEEIQNQLAMLSDDVLENAEAELDKLANQKIMAVGNYSEDVLKNIEDNHNEVMFLYNMLNDKETALKNTVRDIEAVKVSVKQMSETVQNSKTEKKESSRKNSKGRKSRNTSVQKQNTENKENKNININEPVEDEKKQENFFGEGEKSEIVENKERVLELYGQGKTNVEIARELNLGVGEVNLVLGLFK